MILCTSLCANYLPKARLLARSFKDHHPGARCLVCLVEREVPAAAAAWPEFDRLVRAEDLAWPAPFGRMVAGKSMMEAATAVKARWLAHCLQTEGQERDFLYLDADAWVLSGFDEVPARLAEHAVLLTPHLLAPGNLEMERSALVRGAYNLGFLALRRGPQAGAFLAWWEERLRYACLDETARGLFTDQKWVDLAPGFFEVGLLRHPGYNLAPWNMGERRLTAADGWRVDGGPLRFVHFSGLEQGVWSRAARAWAGEAAPDWLDLARNYTEAVRSLTPDWPEPSWSYRRLAPRRGRARGVIRALREATFLPGTDPFGLSAPALGLRWFGWLGRKLRWRLRRLRSGACL